MLLDGSCQPHQLRAIAVTKLIFTGEHSVKNSCHLAAFFTKQVLNNLHLNVYFLVLVLKE